MLKPRGWAFGTHHQPPKSPETLQPMEGVARPRGLPSVGSTHFPEAGEGVSVLWPECTPSPSFPSSNSWAGTWRMNRITERRWEMDTCTKEPAGDKAETHEVQDGAQDGGAYIDWLAQRWYRGITWDRYINKSRWEQGEQDLGCRGSGVHRVQSQHVDNSREVRYEQLMVFNL